MDAHPAANERVASLMPIAAQRRGRVIWRETITPRAATPNAAGIIAQSSWPFPVFGDPAWSNGAGTSSGGFNIRRATLTGFGLTAGQISSVLWIWSTSGQNRATFPAVSDVYRNAFLVIEQGNITNYVDFHNGQQQTLITHRNRWIWSGAQVDDGIVAAYGFRDLAHAPATFTFYAPLDEWHYTDDRFEIDWDGDGSFDHVQSDVTEDVEGYSLAYGLDAQDDMSNVPIAAADGVLRLRNSSGRYTADHASAISPARLRSRAQIRMVNSQSEVMWEGYANSPVTKRESQVDYADFPLSGKSREGLDEHVYRAYTAPTTSQQIFRDVCTDAGLTVGDLLGDSIATGVAVVGVTAIEALRDVRQFIGGWVFERHDGAVSAISPFGLTQESTLNLQLREFAYYADDTAVWRDEEGVRNRVNARQTTIRQRASQTVLDSASYAVPAGESHTFRVDVLGVGQNTITFDTLSVTTTPSPLPTDVTVTTSNLTSESFHLTINNQSSAAQTVTVTATARLTEKLADVDAVIDRTLSQTVYGVKTLVTMPAWFNPVSIGYAEQAANKLEYPKVIAEVTLPRIQRSLVARNALQSLRVGQTVTLSVFESGQSVAKECLVVGLRYRRDWAYGVPSVVVELEEIFSEAAAAAGRFVWGVSQWDVSTELT